MELPNPLNYFKELSTKVHRMGFEPTTSVNEYGVLPLNYPSEILVEEVTLIYTIEILLKQIITVTVITYTYD